MSQRICLVTTGQPSTNPRVVKEADALSNAGYEVHVIGAHWADWADRTDVTLLANKRWTTDIIDWRRNTAPTVFWKTRLRHFAARSAVRAGLRSDALHDAAASRVTPELARAATTWPADLYVAHNLGALPAAAEAAAAASARLGFDAEDFHEGQWAKDDPRRGQTRAIEERYLPVCDYVTASSPGIAEVYARLVRRKPEVLLNVFPLAERPPAPWPLQRGPLQLYWFSQTIGPARGLEQAVAALAEFPDGSAELHLRGACPPVYRQEIDALAKRLKVHANRIIWHPPAAPDEMVRLAAHHAVGLALETGETVNADLALGNKVFTYLLAGVPVIATTTSAHRELAKDCGAAMRLVAPHDGAALAATIRQWIDSPIELAAARESAWQLGSERFNWDREQRALLEVVRGVLNAQRGATRGLAS